MASSKRQSRSQSAINKADEELLRELQEAREFGLFLRQFNDLQDIQNTSSWVLGVAIGAGIFWLELVFLWAIHG